jgi:hypothetical protein
MAAFPPDIPPRIVGIVTGFGIKIGDITMDSDEDRFES